MPFCVLLEGQASSCTEPTAAWQRLTAGGGGGGGGGGEISYRAAVKRRHPLARSPSVVRRAKVDGFIRSCRLPDVPGVKLNAELLEGRTPVVTMEARPLKPCQLQVLNKHYFGRAGWRECYGCSSYGRCMVRGMLPPLPIRGDVLHCRERRVCSETHA